MAGTPLVNFNNGFVRSETVIYNSWPSADCPRRKESLWILPPAADFE